MLANNYADDLKCPVIFFQGLEDAIVPQAVRRFQTTGSIRLLASPRRGQPLPRRASGFKKDTERREEDRAYFERLKSLRRTVRRVGR